MLETDELQFLVTCRDTAVSAARKITINFGNPTQRYAVALFSTIIEYAEAMLILTEARQKLVNPIIARAALDALVDVRLLSQDDDYWRTMELADDSEWKRALEVASAGKNPFVSGMAQDARLIEGRRKHAERIKQFKKEQVPTLRAEERFFRAGMEHEYEVYRALSADVHNNITALIGRHFDMSETPPRLILGNDNVRFGGASLLAVAEALLLSAEIVLRLVNEDDAMLNRARAERERLNGN